jgi:hypothetical protein
MADQLGEAEDSSRAVVVYMEELQGLLLEEQKHGINQFGVFRQVVQLSLAIPAGVT